MEHTLYQELRKATLLGCMVVCCPEGCVETGQEPLRSRDAFKGLMFSVSDLSDQRVANLLGLFLQHLLFLKTLDPMGHFVELQDGDGEIAQL